MRLALYVTCLVDLMHPAIAFAGLRLLESADGEVVVPSGRTCCGQPAWRAGNRGLASALAELFTNFTQQESELLHGFLT